jgi:hypothetical protein
MHEPSSPIRTAPSRRAAAPYFRSDTWKFIAIVAIAIVGLGGIWSWLFPSGAVRYRLTLQVEADGCLHLGSGVIEVGFARQGWSDTQTLGVTASVKGEAVVVDLGTRGLLFALLKGVPAAARTPHRHGYVADPPRMVIKEFNLAPSVGSLKGETLRRLSSVSARADVLDRLPMLVRFRNLDDPKSAEQVHPGDLAASFGPGVRLVGATMETVSVGVWPFNVFGFSGEPITTGIEKRLTWLTDRQGKPGYLHGPRADLSPGALNLNGSEFSQGMDPFAMFKSRSGSLRRSALDQPYNFSMSRAA